jgi:hypothetical protein
MYSIIKPQRSSGPVTCRSTVFPQCEIFKIRRQFESYINIPYWSSFELVFSSEDGDSLKNRTDIFTAMRTLNLIV